MSEQLNGDDHIGVVLAKHAYLEGRVDLQTLEAALEDRLVGTRFRHDARIDGHIPTSCRGDDYEREAY